MQFNTVTYPHPDLRESGQDSLPILDAVHQQLKETSARAEAQDIPREIHIAKSVQHIVNKSLRWSRPAQPLRYTNETYEPAIQHNQVTNCLGYTMLTAELLSEFEVPNLSAHMGGHFMNLVSYTRNGNPDLYLIDSYAPKTSQDLGASMVGVSPEDVLGQTMDPRYHRGMARIDTARFMWRLGRDPDEMTGGGAYPWLHYQKGKTTRLSSGRTSDNEERSYRNRYTKFMTVYNQDISAKVIPAYTAFFEAATDTTMPVETALDATRILHGKFPEIDARAEHEEIKSFVGRLAGKGMILESLDVVERYCSSFTMSNDPRLKGIEARLYQNIAETTGDPAFRGLAIQAYTEAEQRAQYSSETFTGRIKALSEAVRRDSNTLTQSKNTV